MKSFVRLGFVMLIAMAFVCMGCKHEVTNSGSAGGPEIQTESEILEIGMWPQTIKSSDVEITTESKTVGNFTYEKGDDGEWYLRVRESADTIGTEFKYSDGTDLKFGESESYRYFKVEPIKWRVITNNYTGKKLLFSVNILTAMEYNNAKNNYKDSEIRTWLNDEFLNTAFTAAERNLIADTTVDNSLRSALPANDYDPAEWNNGENPNVCENTIDKLFLLSIQEVSNTEYGFNASTRDLKPTDFAKAKGVSYRGGSRGGLYWLRTPVFTDNYRTFIVGAGSYSSYAASVSQKNFGVSPAMCLK